jgi:hypothetical protein
LVARNTTEGEAKRQGFATVTDQASGHCRTPHMSKKDWLHLSLYGSVFLTSILVMANRFL